MRITHVMQKRLVTMVLGITVSLALTAPQALAVLVDVMVVLDNSGSMKQNDPNFLMPQVVSTFATRLTADARFGIVLFAKKVDIALGLTPADAPDFARQVSEGLKHIDYRGQRTDIPAGVERAIYELRTYGRPEAQRLVVVLTDGLVDVGSPAENLKRAHWLREELALEAKRLGIPIFGIALTEAADFQLLQSVAQITSGAYFRVLTAAAIGGTFERISAQIEEMTRQATQAAEAAVSKSITVQGPELVAPPISPVVQSPLIVPDWWPWLFGGIGLIVCGLLAVVVLRSSGHTTPKVVVPAATLYDLGGHSAATQYTITKPVTRIGRDAHTNDIVIAHDTVSSQHAVIEYRDGVFYLRDLRSRNGTFLNGRKISDPEAIREVVLKNRERIRFDAYEFEFTLDALKDMHQTRLAGSASASGTRLRAEPPGTPGREHEAASPRGGEAAANGPADDDESPPTLYKVPPQMEENDMCPHHDSWKATEICAQCGRAVCNICITGKEGRAVCVTCTAG